MGTKSGICLHMILASPDKFCQDSADHRARAYKLTNNCKIALLLSTTSKACAEASLIRNTQEIADARASQLCRGRCQCAELSFESQFLTPKKPSGFRVPVGIPPCLEPSATSSVNAGVLSIGDITWRHPLPTLTWNSSLHGALCCIERQSRCVEHR